MRAIQVHSHGGPDVLEIAEIDPPQPGPGQVLVGLAACGVNYIDTYHRSGLYPMPLPLILGSEGAGRIAAVGDGVPDLRVGDRVAWAAAPGSYAEVVVVDAARAIPVPDGVSDEVAAAVPLQGMTAHYLATSTYPVQPGDTVVVHAAAGGVGRLLTQIVKLRGGRVLATVSTDEKAALARQAGADEVIRYDLVDFSAEASRLTAGEGVAAVYDGVGRTTFDASLASLRRRGTMVLYGASSGPVPPFDPQRLNSGGSLFLTRPTLVHYTATRDELLARARELFGWIAAGKLHVHIGGRYPFAEARRAHEDLQARRTTGKLLLLP